MTRGEWIYSIAPQGLKAGSAPLLVEAYLGVSAMHFRSGR
jgi:hypothetical protein